MLVDQDGNRPFCGQLLQNLADRALPINDRVAAARADAFEHVVQVRIVEQPCHDRHRLHAQGERNCANFP